MALDVHVDELPRQLQSHGRDGQSAARQTLAGTWVGLVLQAITLEDQHPATFRGDQERLVGVDLHVAGYLRLADKRPYSPPPDYHA